MLDLTSITRGLGEWRLAEGHAINEPGQIVASGFDGRSYAAFLLSPDMLNVPEPSILGLFGMSVLGLAASRRRRV